MKTIKILEDAQSIIIQLTTNKKMETTTTTVDQHKTAKNVTFSQVLHRVSSHPLDIICEFRSKLRKIIMEDEHWDNEEMYEKIIALCDEYDK